MKTIHYISIIAVALLTSCGDMLNQPPKSEIDQRYYYKNASDVNNAIIGCYSALHAVMDNEFTVTELRSPNTRAYGTGSTSTTTKEIEQLDQSVISTSHSDVYQYWDACYNMISRCNEVLENLDNVTDPTLHKQYEAECKFLRAHLYFNMVRLWGPVFLVTSTITAQEARYMQRSSVESVYALIEGDLEAIISGSMLPEKYADADLGRVTMNAARAILAKAYMTHYPVGDPKYAAAETLLRDILTSSYTGNPQSYTDLVAFDQVFSVSNEMSKEIIFAVRYLKGGYGLGSPFANYFTPTGSGTAVISGKGSSMNYPSDDVINAFKSEANDARLNISLAENYIDDNGNLVTKAPCRYVKKYMSAISIDFDAENDWPVIRMGDIALLYAELQNELYGTVEEAFKYLNMTRQRAGLTALSTTECPDRLSLRDAIRKERRLELAFENQHWFDLLRWGIAMQVVNQYLATEAFYGEYRSHTVVPLASENQLPLPIPQKVIDINNKVAQNPGY